MCGRFVSTSPPDEVARYFGADEVTEKALDPSSGPNFNTAPTTQILVVRDRGDHRQVDRVRWGLVPSWAKDEKIGNRMINARSETVAEKNAYRRAYRKRRCIVPADAFYEWEKIEGRKAKQPWLIRRPDREPFAFAGLWEAWYGPKDGDKLDEPVISCTILTTEANNAMAEIHDRMPVIVAPAAWDTWLSAEVDDLEVLDSLLVPAPDALIERHPISTAVNNVRNNGPELVEPLPDPASVRR
ncbi:MAG: SOS response-associated peptidase [Actinomycetia bacterium]|nr:SOS response-associated peptidase [Actinomycetes bacterium]MCP3912105.1 SOS response-associated peptidase [Actinomycetes bacterium]MCP4086408.1 SOS response-associated peptidase [Actinomycetes bacterium]